MKKTVAAALIVGASTASVRAQPPARGTVPPRGAMTIRAPGPRMAPSRPDFFEEAELGLGRPIRDYNWLYIDPPEPREVKVHDIVTILVDEKSEVTLNSRFDRTRNANFSAELGEFIRIDDDGNLANAAENAPTIEGTQQARAQFTGRATDQEGIRYRIAATVVDVLPNGHLVLEARKSIRTNQDLWEYSLTGVLRPEDILPNNTSLSENIANLDIVKRQKGRLYASTRLNWGQKLMDMLWPF